MTVLAFSCNKDEMHKISSKNIMHTYYILIFVYTKRLSNWQNQRREIVQLNREVSQKKDMCYQKKSRKN